MKNIIITGGGMVNKGAQAMTLIAVHELRERFPEHKIYLYSPVDLANPKLDRAQFSFDFTGWYPLKFARVQKNFLLRSMLLLKNRRELLEAEEIYRNTDFIVDISGYALGSNWSDKICNDYLDILEFAQGFDVPVYLMPQSFGPFDFPPERQALKERIKKLLPTAKEIFAREQEGYDALVETFCLTNVRLATDLVLGSKEIKLENTFRVIPNMELPTVEKNSVAVIPNSMNANVSSMEEVISLYSQGIQKLLELGKIVYLLSHSAMDAQLCRTLKNQFFENHRVVLLEQDFSCLEFNDLVQKFDYLVASRFHSIVHAYKNGIPCVAMGWATKYHDLLKLFDQQPYIVDIRHCEGAHALLMAIHQMNDNWSVEAKKIRSGLCAVQQENVFDILTS